MIRTSNSIVLATTFSILAATVSVAPQAQAQFTAASSPTREFHYAPTRHDYALALTRQAHYDGLKSGILECTPDAEKCAIANMPLLSQVDTRIDADVQSNSPDGCYDTSIVTVILAALANRSPQLQPVGRTKMFMDIPAGVDSHNQPVPKDIKQLSQQYRWQIHSHHAVTNNANAVEPFFMTEVVADLGAISQPCNPFKYRNCEEDSNGAAHAFSKPVTEDVPNIRVINLMKSGYAPLVAYQRWVPTVTTNANGTKSVKFTYDGHHKVVFSGFQQGKYPLLINDVGSGEQYRVRLTNDLPGRLNTPLQSVAYPMPSRTFIEYEGRSAPSDEVLFIEALDGIRIAPANTTPLPSSREETAIIKDLFGKGCRPFLGRNDGDFLCTSPAGRAACETYQKNGQATQCRKAWK